MRFTLSKPSDTETFKPLKVTLIPLKNLKGQKGVVLYKTEYVRVTTGIGKREFIGV